MTIFCDGGLGNRLGVLVGGLAIAEMLAAEPVIGWPPNTWCGCEFGDLFDSGYRVTALGINALFVQKGDCVFMVHEKQGSAPIPATVPLSAAGVDALRASEANVVYYNNAVPEFVEHRANEILAGLAIRREILSVVNRFCEENGISQSVRGLHFRKTDGGASRKTDENAAMALVVGNPETVFFVCSDDKGVEEVFGARPNVRVFLKRHYVEKLVDGGWNARTTDADGRTWDFNVNRPRGAIVEAFCDMLILSRTDIYTSTPSSFLHFARRFAQIRRGAMCQ
jgi:hypothetical protein